MDSRLRGLQKELEAATKGMSQDDLQRHPEGKWSTALILEHLYLTYTASVKGFERCLDSGKPCETKPTLRDRAATLLVVNLGHLPEGRKSPKFALPLGTATRTVEDLLREIERMDAMIARCEERFGNKTRLLDHAIIGPLTGSQWRGFHLTHGRHHIKQIKRLRQRQ